MINNDNRINNLLKTIYNNKKNHVEKYYNCIPFEGFERFSAYLPGLMKKTYYLITSNSGIGKSKLARSLFIQSPLRYLNSLDKEKRKKIKIDILYFSLEEDKEKIELSELSRLLYTKYKKIISIQELLSIGKYNTIDSDTINKINDCKEDLKSYMNKVQIFDNINTPEGIYNKTLEFLFTIGNYIKKDETFFTKEDYRELEEERKLLKEEKIKFSKKKKEIYGYKTYCPNHYIIILTDHISLLESNKGDTLHQTISNFSKYCVRLRNFFNCSIVNIQQQSAESEKKQFTNTGNSILSKIEPSKDGLGDNKTTARDADIIVSLFSPSIARIYNHNGYNIKKLGDYYRSLSILKNRNGETGLNVGIFMLASTEAFKELPKSEEEEKMEKVYQLIDKLEEEKIKKLNKLKN